MIRIAFCFCLLTLGCGRYIQLRDKLNSQDVFEILNRQEFNLGAATLRLTQSEQNPERFDLKVIKNRSSELTEIDIAVSNSNETRPFWVTQKNYSQLLTSNVLEIPFYQGDVLDVKVICSKQSSRRYECATQRIIIPTVLVFKDHVRLVKDLQKSVDQIWFLEKSKVTTNGFKLDLTADLLVSREGAVIQTLESDFYFAKNGNGKELKPIELSVNKAIGKLTILNIGQHGAEGANGEAFKERAKKGRRGRPALVARVYDPDARIHHVRCQENHGDGHPGENGHMGNPGQNGFNGGNTALLKIRVVDDIQFELNPILLPGNGGKGGKGGPGQLGGLGGDPGINAGDCAFTAKHGPQGLDGKPGIDGKVGQPGEVSKYCIWLGHHQRGQCD